MRQSEEIQWLFIQPASLLSDVICAYFVPSVGSGGSEEMFSYGPHILEA